MKEIILTKGKVTLVDDDDYEWLMDYNWHFGAGYACISRVIDGKKIKFFMHRMIMDNPDGFQVDHINNNTLDNRKNNLRVCSMLQNCYNRRGRHGTSEYKGVHRIERKKGTRWVASIQYEKKKINLGSYDTEIEAAVAYNQAAKRFHGEFALINKI